MPHAVHAARQIRAISVLNFTVGLDRPNVSDKHWVYFPEPDYIFYRAGSYSAVHKNAAPPGCRTNSSLGWRACGASRMCERGDANSRHLRRGQVQ